MHEGSPKPNGRSEVDESVRSRGTDRIVSDAGGTAGARRAAEAGGPARAGGLVAEAGGGPSAETEGPELAEAAVLAKADLVVAAATKGELIVRALVSTSSPADAPQRRHYRA